MAEETGTLFASGFEDETDLFTTDFTGKTDTASMLSVDATAGRHGGKCLKLTLPGDSTVASYVYKSGFNNLTDVYVRFYCKIVTTTTAPAGDFNNMVLCSLYNGETEVARIGDFSGGNSALGRDSLRARVNTRVPNTTIAATGYGLITPDCWHRIEARYVKNATTGGMQWWLDGIDMGSDFTLNTDANAVTEVRFGHTNTPGVAWPSGWQILIDDARLETAAIGAYNEVVGTRTQDFGLHQSINSYDPSTYGTRIAVLDACKGTVSRINVSWNRHEPEEQGTFVWTNLDASVNALVAAGKEIVGTIMDSPQWANGDEDSLVVPGTDADATYLAWESDYCDFCTAVVARYKDRVTRWEIWNEPNEDFFWKPAANQTQYNSLYAAARTAILAEDATADVAFCFTAPNASGDIKGTTFLQAAYTAGLTIDVVSMHVYQTGSPYTYTDSQNNFTDIDRVRKVMLTNSADDTPLWLTEWGWTTASVSEANQALYIGYALKMLRDKFPYVSIVTLFADIDGVGEGEYGVADAPGAVSDYKPAVATYRAFMDAFAASPSSTAPIPFRRRFDAWRRYRNADGTVR